MSTIKPTQHYYNRGQKQHGVREKRRRRQRKVSPSPSSSSSSSSSRSSYTSSSSMSTGSSSRSRSSLSSSSSSSDEEEKSIDTLTALLKKRSTFDREMVRLAMASCRRDEAMELSRVLRKFHTRMTLTQLVSILKCLGPVQKEEADAIVDAGLSCCDPTIACGKLLRSIVRASVTATRQCLTHDPSKIVTLTPSATSKCHVKCRQALKEHLPVGTHLILSQCEDRNEKDVTARPAFVDAVVIYEDTLELSLSPPWYGRRWPVLLSPKSTATFLTTGRYRWRLDAATDRAIALRALDWLPDLEQDTSLGVASALLSSKHQDTPLEHSPNLQTLDAALDHTQRHALDLIMRQPIMCIVGLCDQKKNFVQALLRQCHTEDKIIIVINGNQQELTATGDGLLLLDTRTMLQTQPPQRKSAIDLLLVDNAHEISFFALLPFLASCTRLVLLGNLDMEQPNSALQEVVARFGYFDCTYKDNTVEREAAIVAAEAHAALAQNAALALSTAKILLHRTQIDYFQAEQKHDAALAASAAASANALAYNQDEETTKQSIDQAANEAKLRAVETSLATRLAAALQAKSGDYKPLENSHNFHNERQYRHYTSSVNDLAIPHAEEEFHISSEKKQKKRSRFYD